MADAVGQCGVFASRAVRMDAGGASDCRGWGAQLGCTDLHEQLEGGDGEPSSLQMSLNTQRGASLGECLLALSPAGTTCQVLK